MKVRVSRPRKEFGLDAYNFTERDAGEGYNEIKVTKTGYFTKKKVLEIGLQAANKMMVTTINILILFRGSLLKPTLTEWSTLSSNMTPTTSWKS